MFRPIASLIAIVLLAAACSSPAASQGGGASTAPGASQGAAQSTGPGASQGGGGGATGDACDLITADEAASVAGVASTTPQGSGDDPFYCSYLSDGQPVVLTSLLSKDIESVYGIYANEQGATIVSGIGDKAVFSPSTFTLYVVKGTRLMGISAGTPGITAEQRLDLEKQLGVVAAGRL